MTRHFPISAALLLVCALLLAGCGTPEEKTLLLPENTSQEDESEETGSAKDLTVKKIYVYSYETWENLAQSAFLQGSAENEINILSDNGQDDGAALAYRQVDYRYGFYDTAGEFLGDWKDYFDMNEEDSELYIEKLIPSPDGKQLLVYIRSAYWDTLFIQLFTLGEEKPRDLYAGDAGQAGYLKGCFSPGGRWVTFDTLGAIFGEERFALIYDCSQLPSPSEGQISIPVYATGRICPPSRVIYPDFGDHIFLWDAGLVDLSDNVGLLSFSADDNEYGFSLDYHEDSPDYAQIPFSDWESPRQSHTSAILLGDVASQSPYLQYAYDAEENCLYYLDSGRQLRKVDLKGGSVTVTTALQFPNTVQEFLRPDSGDILAAVVQEAELTAAEEKLYQDSFNSESDNFISTDPDNYTDILSTDLYLYPEGTGEGILLYKNLHNLLHMEYDGDTGRILLETCEDGDLTHRKCIILEF